MSTLCVELNFNNIKISQLKIVDLTQTCGVQNLIRRVATLEAESGNEILNVYLSSVQIRGKSTNKKCVSHAESHSAVSNPLEDSAGAEAGGRN